MEIPFRVVTDKEADDSLRPLEALEIEVAEEFAHCSDIPKTDIPFTDQRNNPVDNLTSSELKLVMAVIKNPMQASSEYPKLAKISPNTFQKARPSLIDKGLIREHKMESGGRGRSTILLEPLPTAIELFSSDDNCNPIGG
jgi:hypothetical protein